MAAPNDPLFTLIKSLNKAEKRYFKMNCSKQDGSKDYLELFDAIDNLKEYDEEKLKSRNRDKSFIKHYAVVKNYLFNAIVESLHDQSYYDTPEYKLGELIKKIQILYQKSLIELCLKYIEKAKKIAIDHEMFPELTKLLTIQHQIATKNSSQLFKKRKEIQLELNSIAEKSYNLSQYFQLELNTGYYVNSQNLPVDSPEMIALLNHPLLLKKENALSNKALSVFLRIHAKISESKGQKKEAVYFTHEILKNLEANSALLFENPLVYARTINTYLQAAIDIREFNYFEHYLSVLKNLLSLKISPEHLNTIKGFYYLNLIHFNIVYGNFENVIDVIQENKTDLNSQLIPIKFRIGITYFECVALIGLEQYKAALKILSTTLGGSENIVIPIKRISKILSIIVHYELKNISILMNELDASSKYIRELENNMGEKLLLKYLKLLIDCMDKKEETSCLNKLKDELIAIESNPKEALSISYFDFLSWVESKIENKPLQDILKAKALKYASIK